MDINQPNRNKPKQSSNMDITSPKPVSKKPESPKKSKRSKKGKFAVVIIVVLLIASLAGMFVLYQKYQDTQSEVQKLSTVQGQQELNKTQINQLLGEMRSIIVLPEGEDPVVATITDISKLENNDFYKDAKNGDKVVVFAEAKKAYIYRPDTKTIVNVGAFQIDTSKPAASGTQTQN